MSLGIPIVEVDHMQAHILAHFIRNPKDEKAVPEFPFLCLTVSGGHTQIVQVNSHFDMKVIGRTIDDAAGEAFDKAAKIMGLPYPGGPLVDKYGKDGNPEAFRFSRPVIPGLDYSFSGLKTSFLYFVRDRLREDASFIDRNTADLCASIQQAIVSALMEKLQLAVRQTGIRQVAIAGGVSANSALRKELTNFGDNTGVRTFIPEFSYSTDNAAMIAMAGYFRYLSGEFADLSASPYSRSTV